MIEDYRPISTLAVLGLAVSLLSPLAMAFPLAIPIAATGMTLSAIALRQIGQGVSAGGRVALSAMILSTGMAISAPIWHTWLHCRENPEGVSRVSLARIHLAEKNLAASRELARWDRQRILIKGYPDWRSSLEGPVDGMSLSLNGSARNPARHIEVSFREPLDVGTECLAVTGEVRVQWDGDGKPHVVIVDACLRSASSTFEHCLRDTSEGC